MFSRFGSLVCNIIIIAATKIAWHVFLEKQLQYVGEYWYNHILRIVPGIIIEFYFSYLLLFLLFIPAACLGTLIYLLGKFKRKPLTTI